MSILTDFFRCSEGTERTLFLTGSHYEINGVKYEKTGRKSLLFSFTWFAALPAFLSEPLMNADCTDCADFFRFPSENCLNCDSSDLSDYTNCYA